MDPQKACRTSSYLQLKQEEVACIQPDGTMYNGEESKTAPQKAPRTSLYAQLTQKEDLSTQAFT